MNNIKLIDNNSSIIYPNTQKQIIRDTYFGKVIDDPYRWLEDAKSKDVQEWIDAENNVTDNYLRKIPFRDKILKRLTALVNHETIGLPFKNNDAYYFFKNDGLQNQNVLYAQQTLTDTPQLILDPNEFSNDGNISLNDVFFSHNGKFMAYSISRNGSDWSEIFVMDIQSRLTLGDHIKGIKYSDVSWHGDGFYYCGYGTQKNKDNFNPINEIHKVYYHKIGDSQNKDKLIYQSSNTKRICACSISDDESVLFLYESTDGVGNSLYLKDLRSKNRKFTKMSLDINSSYIPIGVINGNIYLITNDNAPKFKVMVTTIDHPIIIDWKLLVEEKNNVLLGVDIIDNKLFLTYNEDVVNHVYIYSLEGREIQEVNLPSLGSVSFSGSINDKECFFNFTSSSIPDSTYSYDIEHNTCKLLRSPQIDFNIEEYHTSQIFYESKDGTRIPMFLTYNNNLKRDGNNPVYLYGYGGFNISETSSFSTALIPFLECGGIYAIANIRGGGEYGETWHQAGVKINKQNVFDDFIAAAEYLITNRYTNSDKIAIVGRSNGGLLVGACMTQRPDLFKVAVPQVGVMDMLRYHKFTIGWSWANEYGTSEDSEEMFEYLLSYSPIHNIKPNTHYPATLIITADHDDRVIPAHSYKFAATLQENNNGINPMIIRIAHNCGHGGGNSVIKVLEEVTDILSFILFNMGYEYKLRNSLCSV